ncbi:MAG: glycoside hydrolase family 95 protein [Tannerellaceae bacterium]|nr:glycoside hydrolase family 95 protein [Tannerellaceae bacterium]
METSVWYSTPATGWMEAIPMGNGRLGMMVYGGIENETIALNEVTLWSGQHDPEQEIACGKEKLTEIRQLFFEGRLEEGNQLGYTLFIRPASFFWFACASGRTSPEL